MVHNPRGSLVQVQQEFGVVVLACGLELELEILHQAVVFLDVSIVAMSHFLQKLNSFLCESTLMENGREVLDAGVNALALGCCLGIQFKGF